MIAIEIGRCLRHASHGTGHNDVDTGEPSREDASRKRPAESTHAAPPRISRHETVPKVPVYVDVAAR